LLIPFWQGSQLLDPLTSRWECLCCKPAAVLLSNMHATTASADEDVLSVRDPFGLPDVINICRPLTRLLTMEDQQQHVEDDYCVGSYTLFDILQAAPRLAELLPPQGCKTLAASCTSMRSWHRRRVTVIRLTDPNDMALLLLQPQHWPRLLTVMYDSTAGLRLPE